jgi:hypothetical protein
LWQKEARNNLRIAMRPVRDEMIKRQIAALRISFPCNMPQWRRLPELRHLYDTKDYSGMVGFVRDSMHLSVRIKVGLVNHGGRLDAPAWVTTPDPMPFINTPEFNRTLVTMYLRKSFLESAKYEKIVAAIAHEMSHIVLNGLNHPLREQEEAVDLTAMLLGYRDIYVAGAEYSEVGPPKFLGKLFAEIKRSFSGDRTRQFRWLGYLTPEEVCFAAKQMGRWRVHKPVLGPNRGIVILANLVERVSRVALIVASLIVVGFLISVFQR